MFPSGTLLKVAIDQLIWRPCLVAYTFVGMALFQGQGWDGVYHNLRHHPTAKFAFGTKRKAQKMRESKTMFAGMTTLLWC